ncbi:DUF72 domain-containing protein [Lichenifustis flavocetrariae]|uniref:DUF72 domain-containing protein n=1 Tax=Lichenifustis flavocetrariae TaxID=2949735 RepID=A0AA42CPL5_9HYPH|nr:DUF72 domain-containing protein [Lichenifustis flavocetrariae]MCW6510505.1 DUF72 domain-containing protein [Lichenifustis flavocetrariae]
MVNASLPDHQFVGTAGWSIAADYADLFPAGGSHLERYAARLDAVEINSSFYRPHRRATYARWAASVPPRFRFAVKLPKAMTHERRLEHCEDLLDRFTEEVSGLGEKLGVLLVQLPPSLAFEPDRAEAFFAALARRTPAALACEPRHPGWFSREADEFLRGLGVARVAADPAPVVGAGEPGGSESLAYWRLHGTPRIYYSNYDEAALADIGARLDRSSRHNAPVWCVFDNTAAFHALGNALAIREQWTQTGKSVGPSRTGTTHQVDTDRSKR